MNLVRLIGCILENNHQTLVGRVIIFFWSFFELMTTVTIKRTILIVIIMISYVLTVPPPFGSKPQSPKTGSYFLL